MSVAKERFEEGYTWTDWLDLLGNACTPWIQRYNDTALGPLRADFQAVPTPRYALCLFDRRAEDSLEIVPSVVRACDQAGEGGGVDIRLFPHDEAPDIVDQFPPGPERALPLCAVFDDDWVQVGVWWNRADRAEDDRVDMLRDLLIALVGRPVPPWRANRYERQHLRRQAEQAGEHG